MFARVRRVGAGLASLAGLRTELFAIELREQAELWLRVALLLLATVALGCIGLGFTAVFIAVAFWDSQPLVALGVFALLFLGSAVWCVRQVSVAFATAPKPFAATIAEFQRDAQVLQGTPPPVDATAVAGSPATVDAASAASTISTPARRP